MMLQILVHPQHPRSDLSYPRCSIKPISYYSLLSTFLLCTMACPCFCLSVFHCFGFFECHGSPITKLLSLKAFQLGTVSCPTEVLQGPWGGLSVLSILHQPLNSLSTFALSFISLCASLKLFPSSYGALSNLLPAIIYWHPGLSPTHTFTAGSRLESISTSLPIIYLGDISIHVASPLLDLFISPDLLPFFLFFVAFYLNDAMNGRKLEFVINQYGTTFPLNSNVKIPPHQPGTFISLSSLSLLTISQSHQGFQSIDALARLQPPTFIKVSYISFPCRTLNWMADSHDNSCESILVSFTPPHNVHLVNTQPRMNSSTFPFPHLH